MAAKEKPVCTCIARSIPLRDGEDNLIRNLRIIRVLDPFCQIVMHRMAGSTLKEPTYEKKD